MKKVVVYMGLITMGLVLGYLLFHPSKKEEEHTHKTEMAEQNWTCSMHPQIMRSEPGDCPICGMDLILEENTSDGLSKDQFRMTENAIALANIQTTVVGRGTSPSNVVQLSGTIRENEESKAVQTAHFGGRIENLFVESLGEPVRRGQKIATLYAPELVAAQQELLIAVKLKKSEPQLYQSVRKKLQLWKLSEQQINEIESSGEVTSNIAIYANVNGVVTKIKVNDGEHVLKGQALFTVANLQTVWASFDVFENQIQEVKRGQQIRITTNAFPEKSFEAEIAFIDPILNTENRTVMARAVLNNRDGLLKPGMFVEGQILKTSATIDKAAIKVPKSAVLWTGERSVVYVKKELQPSVFEMRQVLLGDEYEDSYEILKGLRGGEEIVTQGVFTVDAAAQLQGKKSMMDSIVSENTNDAQLPNDFQKNFKKVLELYFPLKDALVQGDLKEVSDHASSMYQTMNNILTKDFENDYQKNWNVTMRMTKAIAFNEVLENQRTHFIELNEHLVALAKELDIEDTIYIQKCPMANNNQGAMWLSLEKEIKNPYYGAQMLKCGSIIDTL